MADPIILRRVEVWDALECDSGSRLAVIPDVLAPGPEELVELQGREKLTFKLRRESDAWTHLQEQRIIRVELTDGSVTEWRITQLDDEHTQRGELIGVVACDGIILDLGERSDLVSRANADGTVAHDFELYGLSVSDHIDQALTAAPSYFVAGTVEPTDDRDFSYRGDTPLSAIRELLQLGDGGELEVERNGATNYQVHIRTEVGDGAEVAHLRYRKNLRAIKRSRDTSEMQNRVYPLGADVEGVRATMAEASWEITGKATHVLTLGDVPILYDDQLNGLYAFVEGDPTTSSEITDSDATAQTITVADGTNFTVGDRVHIRADSAGKRLTYLENPTSVDASSGYGLRPGPPLERPDIPPIDNLVTNPFLSTWSGGSPTGYTAIGAPTITENTDGQYRRLGTSSARVQAATAEGIATDAIGIAPTGARPYFSAQINLYVVSGSVKLVLEDATNSEDFPGTDAARVYTSETGGWVDNMAVGGIDLNKRSSTSAKVRVVALEDGTEFYLDAVQLTQSQSGHETFYGGRGSNDLWHAANDHLAEYSTPKVAYDVDVLDLQRADPDAFEFDELVLGGTVKVYHPDLDIDEEQRIVRLRRRLTDPNAVRLRISNQPHELAALLSSTRRRRKGMGGGDGTGGQRPTLKVQQQSASGSEVTLRLTATSDGDRRVAIYYRSGKDPSDESWTRSPTSGWSESGATEDVVVTRPASGSAPVILEAYVEDEAGAVSESLGYPVEHVDQAEILNVFATVFPDGSVDVAVTANAATQSYRWAAKTGASPAYPSEAEVEAGTVRTVDGTDTFTLAAGTVSADESFRLGVAGYTNADGTGLDTTAADHGEIQYAEDAHASNPPSISEVELDVYTNASNEAEADITLQIVDGAGADGDLTIWTNKAGYTSPDPTTDTPDATVAVNAGQTIGDTGSAADVTTAALTDIPIAPVPYGTKRVYVRWDGDDGRSTGIVPVVLSLETTPAVLSTISTSDPSGTPATGVGSVWYKVLP